MYYEVFMIFLRAELKKLMFVFIEVDIINLFFFFCCHRFGGWLEVHVGVFVVEFESAKMTHSKIGMHAHELKKHKIN